MTKNRICVCVCVCVPVHAKSAMMVRSDVISQSQSGL